jgi:DNA-binding GntR family transcriptional regulator
MVESVRKKSRTTADAIADALREEILRGSLEEAEGLRQDRIARRFGVSTIPVREALLQLSSEGIIEFIPNRGAFVSSLSASEVLEIYALREVMEIYALERAFPHLNEEDFKHAQCILPKMDLEKDIYNWDELNWEFHATLYRLADMPYLMRVLRGIYANMISYLSHNVRFPDDIEMRLNHRLQHQQILDLCRKGDLEIARILLRRHLQSSSELLARVENQHLSD